MVTQISSGIDPLESNDFFQRQTQSKFVEDFSLQTLSSRV